ncbi:MAG: DNA translocase FtsK 4TM domain-containing protein [bacterium]
MAEFDDDIIIKRKKTASSQTKKPTAKKVQKRSYDKQYKVIAVMLCISAFLILLALLSYSRLDESLAQFKLADYFGLLRGDEYLMGKADNVRNWLGPVGSAIAYLLYKNTIGFAILLLPLFIFLWGRILYWGYEYPKTLIRYSIFYIVSGILFASLMGTLQHFGWGAKIPDEFSGAIGFFLSQQASMLIKPLGAAMLFLALLAGSVILGTDFSFDNFFKTVGKSMEDAGSNLNELIKTDKKADAVTEIPEPVIAKKAVEPEKEIIINKIDDMVSKTAFDEIVKAEKPREPFKEPIKEVVIKKYDDSYDFELNPDSDEDVVSSFDNPILKSAKPGANAGFVVGTPIPTPGKAIEAIAVAKAVPVIEATEALSSEIVLDEIPRERKPLIVTVEDAEEEQEYNEPLGTAIHDEEIDFYPPTFELLDRQKDIVKVEDSEIKANTKILQEKFETFKIYIDNISATTGPVVTQYEFEIAPGIKVSSIAKYGDDLAMALKAKGVRIIAPIPGKGTIGIEIPNLKRAMVRFHDVINSAKFATTKAILPLALGRTISGEIFIADLADLPHLLIAGATGSGKSIGMNTIICSLLYKMHPSELKFVIIDPKKVEMPHYAELARHYIASSPDIDSAIITKPEDAIAILKSTVLEMERRYDIMGDVRIRNIQDYNSRARSGLLDNTYMIHRPMPYIVVIIDELADLMMTASKEIEGPITRLAQMSRAVGIHLVIATQRPSVDVITGLIKSNFPARIAFSVSSKIDSRTILDTQGAEKLLGKGDMLCLPQGVEAPIRIQNAYISTEEVENITQYIGNQKGYSKPYMLPSLNEEQSGESEEYSKDDRDALFEEAARLIIYHQQGSVSLIQRRLKVGYARAGRMIDQLEKAGVVGRFEGSKSRAVLMQSEMELEAIL